ncbi:protein of unknown function (plasmid) [Cupriavidus taiwanensis]|uniref:Uncharacterized protein n=1 Tax=Cupriavidus taiwanensis TaxID=164546 RepID=A0A9Q7XSA9_9BURK|nr:protein of unknown function [Cupriavidus taiwanensis]
MAMPSDEQPRFDMHLPIRTAGNNDSSGFPTALSDDARYLCGDAALTLILPTSGERHARQEYPCRADP